MMTIAESVWTWAGWLQWGHRGGPLGLPDAPNCVLVAGGLHQHCGWGSWSCGPAAAFPLRILAPGKCPHSDSVWMWSVFSYLIKLQAYHVTDAALGYFSPKQSHSLSILRLQSCWELTNHGIVNIGKYWAIDK